MNILVKVPDTPPQTLVIDEEEIIVGRDPEVNLTIHSNYLSRKHAKITFKGDHYTVEDLDSKNGTFLGKEKIPPRKKVTLSLNQEINLGNGALITLREDDRPPPLPDSPAPELLLTPLLELAKGRVLRDRPVAFQESVEYHQERFGEKGYNKLVSLFKKDLKFKLQELEEGRKKVFIPPLIFAFLAPLVYLLGLWAPFLWLNFVFLGKLMIGFLVVALGVSWIFYQTYRREFKDRIVQVVIGQIDPGWNYSHEGKVASSIYLDSGLFRKTFDLYQGEDLITGNIGKTDFEFSELATHYITRNQKGQTTKHEIFRGIFFHADFNKNIRNETYIFPDVAESFLGSFLGKKLQTLFSALDSRNGSLVNLENPIFEKEFVVYSTDQNEARYILTPKIMHSIVRLKRKIGKKMYLSFKCNRLYLAIGDRDNLFEPRLFTSGVQLKDIKRIFDILGTLSLIVEEMDLNHRIWTKS